MDWLSDHLWVGWLGLAVALGALELVSLDLFLIMLAGPARTSQRSTLSHVYWQFAPQKAPHETVLWQSIAQ